MFRPRMEEWKGEGGKEEVELPKIFGTFFCPSKKITCALSLFRGAILF